MIQDVLIGSGAGIVAGLAFFGGLYWTLSRLAGARWPLLLGLTSFLLRSALVTLLILAVSGGQPWRVLAALAALISTRTLLVAKVRRRLKPAGEATWT